MYLDTIPNDKVHERSVAAMNSYAELWIKMYNMPLPRQLAEKWWPNVDWTRYGSSELLS